MRTQKAFGVPCTAIVMLTVFVSLSRPQSALGQKYPDREIQEEKRSELLSRQSLPKWLAELPDSVPHWMKVAASKYRGSPQQIICAVKSMSKALSDMQAARAQNCDDYFRCRGSRDATRCGAYAASFVTQIRYKQEWRTGGMDRHYNSAADLFGSLGGNCLAEYKYKTYGTSHECNVPWYYH